MDDQIRIVFIAEQLACVEREIKRRERLYPAGIKTGRMRQREADRELAAMRAVRDTLEIVRVRTI